MEDCCRVVPSGLPLRADSCPIEVRESSCQNERPISLFARSCGVVCPRWRLHIVTPQLRGEVDKNGSGKPDGGR